MKVRRLKKTRLDCGMNMSQLARKAELQQGLISWIESGRFIPYDSQLEKIAKALGWEGDPHALLEEVGDDDAAR